VTAGSGTYDAHGDVRGDVTKGMLRVWFSSSANVTLLFSFSSSLPIELIFSVISLGLCSCACLICAYCAVSCTRECVHDFRSCSDTRVLVCAARSVSDFDEQRW